MVYIIFTNLDVFEIDVIEPQLLRILKLKSNV